MRWPDLLSQNSKGIGYQLQTVFGLKSAAGVLITTALIKVISVFRHDPYLAALDPVFFFLTGREAMALAAVLEIVLAVILLKRIRLQYQIVALVSCAHLFVAYRLANYVITGGAKCFCLGFVGRWLNLPPVATSIMGYVLLAYLLAVGYFTAYKQFWASTPAKEGAALPVAGGNPEVS